MGNIIRSIRRRDLVVFSAVEAIAPNLHVLMQRQLYDIVYSCDEKVCDSYIHGDNVAIEP